MIYLFGDLHGAANINRFEKDSFPQGLDLTKEDYVIVLGDFGIPWNNVSTKGYKEEIEALKLLNHKPWTTLFIDGNHENFHNLYEYEEIELLGGKVHRLMDSIYHLERGYVYTIEGKKFFSFGGALSIDKGYRIPGLSWWPQELHSKEEVELGLNSLNDNNNKVDYIITHTTSNANIKLLLNIDDDLLVNDPCSKFFDVVDKLVSYKYWFFGHFHMDSILRNRDGSSCYCLYKKYIELDTKSDNISMF